MSGGAIDDVNPYLFTSSCSLTCIYIDLTYTKFGTMSNFSNELQSMQTPEAKNVAEMLQNGSKAPSTSQLPLPDGRPTIVVFLRHCGCPCEYLSLTTELSLTPRQVAERTFKSLATLSEQYKDVHCVAVSHSSSDATERWIPQVGGAWDVDMLVDEKRDLYAKWGLGLTTTWQTLGPTVLYSAFRLGMAEGIWNRPTESGTRWQKSGAFAVDGDGTVRWVHVDASADDVPDLAAAVKSLGLAS